ncbi:hypothetical protein HispidOSU_029306 [Sigmodon hispidus]
MIETKDPTADTDSNISTARTSVNTTMGESLLEEETALTSNRVDITLQSSCWTPPQDHGAQTVIDELSALKATLVYKVTPHWHSCSEERNGSYQGQVISSLPAHPEEFPSERSEELVLKEKVLWKKAVVQNNQKRIASQNTDRTGSLLQPSARKQLGKIHLFPASLRTHVLPLHAHNVLYTVLRSKNRKAAENT